MLEKKDWTTNLIDDLKTILKTDFGPIYDGTYKRVAAMKDTYTKIVQDDTTVTDEIKKELFEFINISDTYDLMGVTNVTESITNDFAISYVKDIEIVLSAPAPEILKEVTDRVRDSIIRSCPNVIANLEESDIETEQSYQDELVRKNVNVPNYIYVFDPSDLPIVVEDLDETQMKLVTDANDKKAAVAAIIEVVAADLTGVAHEINSQIIDAQKAFILNIASSTKLSQEEKSLRTQQFDEVLKKFNEAFEAEKTKNTVYIQAQSVLEPTNIIEFLNSVTTECLAFGKEFNKIGKEFFDGLIPITKDIN